MTLREELIQYCNDVIAGNIVACIKNRWACMRFLRDIKNEGTVDFPYIFNEDKANNFIDWMRLFKHRKGVLQGEYIEPHIIQEFIFGNIYGWYHSETGYRRFTKAYWQVGRKNAKSQGLGSVGSYELMALGEGASEVYCAATKTEQAKIVWEETEAMLNNCEDLAGKFKIAYGRIIHPRSGSFMKALSKEDKKGGDGLNPQCGIIDEYHAHETSEMYDIIDSGMGARTQPLIFVITTAGFNLSHPCYRVEYNLVSKILNPSIEFNADNYFAMVNEMDTDDEGNLIDKITDESAWIKANPIACSYPEGVKYIRERLQLAQEEPDKMRDFLTKNMNVWINQRANGYMNMDKWAACKGDIPELKGKECFAGIDLSSKIDLTSISFEFVLGDAYVVFSHSFMPEDTVFTKSKTDKTPYDLWIKQGWITTTPGAVVDYRFIKQYIDERVEINGWKIKEICYDPYNCTQFAQELQDDGFTCIEIRQGIPTLSEPTKNFREETYKKKIIHDGNPVLGFAISNAVTRQDHNGNIMLDKDKSTERIDPIASLINAHVRAMLNPDNTHIYEKRGMRSL